MNPKFEETVGKLEKKGFKVNRVESDCVYMSRKRGPSTFYADVEDHGGIVVNGEPLAEFLKGL
jgi:hypothetical protein